MKKKINKFLEAKIVQVFLICLILLNLIVFIFQTDSAFYNLFKGFIKNFEMFSVTIFSIEYLLRVMAVDKFKNIFKPLMIIDLLAILPFYLSFIPINTMFLRVLRVFRIIRIAKITRYTEAFENIKRAFICRKSELAVTGVIFVLGLTFSSILIYYAEHATGQATFKSIPSSFWWSVMTFTTVGYGDAFPLTAIGKFVGAFTAIIGVCLHGLLVGIIGTAFIEAIQANKKKSYAQDIENTKVDEDSYVYEKINN